MMLTVITSLHGRSHCNITDWLIERHSKSKLRMLEMLTDQKIKNSILCCIKVCLRYQKKKTHLFEL